MAIFPGEELVPVMTPDGRTLQLPRSLAAMSGQMQQIAPPRGGPMQIPGVAPVVEEAPVPILPPPGDPMSVTGGQIPTEAAQIVETAPAPMPDYVVGTVDNSPGGGLDKRDKAYQEQARAQAAYEASPPGQVDAASRRTDEGILAEAKAREGAAILEAATQDTLAKGINEREKRINEHLANKAATEQKAVDDEAAALDDVMSLRKKIAGTRIDRSLDHPVMTSVFAAIAGLGSAMKGEKVDTLNIIYGAIDRKVAAQMQDLDQLARVYGLSKDTLADVKSKNVNRIALYTNLIAAETDKAQRHAEAVKTGAAGAQTRANAQIVSAQLLQRADEKSLEALKYRLDFTQREKQVTESLRHNRAQEGLESRRITQDMDKYILGLRADDKKEEYKASAKRAEDNQKLGLRHTVENKPLLTVKGMQMLKEAEGYENQAQALAQVKDPMRISMAQPQIQMFREKAAWLRGEAEVTQQIRHRSDTQAGELQKSYSAAQGMTQLVDEIKQLASRSYGSTDAKRAAVQTKMQLLKGAYRVATGSGAHDKGLETYLTKTLGGDPTAGFDMDVLLDKATNGLLGTDAEAYKGRLDAVADATQNDVFLKMRERDYGGTKEDLFLTREARAETPEGRAIAEFEKARTPSEIIEQDVKGASTARKVIDKVAYPFGGGEGGTGDFSLEGKAAAAKAGASKKYEGLSKTHEPSLEALIDMHKHGSPTAGPMLVRRAVVGGGAASTALMNTLKAKAPDLYDKARTQLHAESVSANTAAREQIGAGLMGVPALKQQVIDTMKDGKVTDFAGYNELATRAETDPDAAAAIVEIVSAHAGSVFGRIQ